MPFIDLGSGLSDAKESESVIEGKYDLEIVAVDLVTERGKNHISVGCRIDSAPIENPALVRHYIALPKDEDDDQKRSTKLLMCKRFLTLFNVPFEGNGFDPEDLNGCAAANVTLTQEVAKDSDGNELDYTVNRIRLPRLKDEPEETEQPSRRRRRA